MLRLLGSLAYRATAPLHFLNNNPVWYRGRQITLVFFGFFAALEAIAITTVLWLFLSLTGAANLSRFPLAVTFLFGAIWLGARIFHLLALGKKFWQNPLKYLFQTGFYVQGGLLGALLWSLWAAPFLGISWPRLLDGLLWGSALGQFWGRLGCFNYGCCFGRCTQPNQGVPYSHSDAKVLRLRPELSGRSLHPVQLYTAYANLLAFLLASLFQPWRLPAGVLALILLAVHGVLRIVLENFREDIYFQGKRNRLTWRAAFASILLAGGLALVGPVFASGFWQISAGQSLSWGQEFWAVGLAGLLAFCGYGIHGQKLGYFPGAKDFS